MDTADNVGPVNISTAERGTQQTVYSIPHVHTRAYKSLSHGKGDVCTF
jgi:hypothetical protein